MSELIVAWKFGLVVSAVLLFFTSHTWEHREEYHDAVPFLFWGLTFLTFLFAIHTWIPSIPDAALVVIMAFSLALCGGALAWAWLRWYHPEDND